MSSDSKGREQGEAEGEKGRRASQLGNYTDDDMGSLLLEDSEYLQPGSTHKESQLDPLPNSDSFDPLHRPQDRVSVHIAKLKEVADSITDFYARASEDKFSQGNLHFYTLVRERDSNPSSRPFQTHPSDREDNPAFSNLASRISSSPAPPLMDLAKFDPLAPARARASERSARAQAVKLQLEERDKSMKISEGTNKARPSVRFCLPEESPVSNRRESVNKGKESGEKREGDSAERKEGKGSFGESKKFEEKRKERITLNLKDITSLLDTKDEEERNPLESPQFLQKTNRITMDVRSIATLLEEDDDENIDQYISKTKDLTPIKSPIVKRVQTDFFLENIEPEILAARQNIAHLKTYDQLADQSLAYAQNTLQMLRNQDFNDKAFTARRANEDELINNATRDEVLLGLMQKKLAFEQELGIIEMIHYSSAQQALACLIDNFYFKLQVSPLEVVINELQMPTIEEPAFVNFDSRTICTILKSVAERCNIPRFVYGLLKLLNNSYNNLKYLDVQLTYLNCIVEEILELVINENCSQFQVRARLSGDCLIEVRVDLVRVDSKLKYEIWRDQKSQYKGEGSIVEGCLEVLKARIKEIEDVKPVKIIA